MFHKLGPGPGLGLEVIRIGALSHEVYTYDSQARVGQRKGKGKTSQSRYLRLTYLSDGTGFVCVYAGMDGWLALSAGLHGLDSHGLI